MRPPALAKAPPKGGLSDARLASSLDPPVHLAVIDERDRYPPQMR